MVTLFLGGFVCSLVPSFIVYVVWTMTSAINELDTE